MDITGNSLKNICIKWLVSNLEEVTCIESGHFVFSYSDDGTPETYRNTVLMFRNEDTFLPAAIGNTLFKELDRYGFINDLVISLFSPKAIELTSVKISCGQCIGLKGWQILACHKLKSVEISGLAGCTFSEMSAFLGQPAFNNLIELSLPNNIMERKFSPISNKHTDRWEFKRKHLPFWTPVCAKKDFLTADISPHLLKKRAECYCQQKIGLRGNIEFPKSLRSLCLSGTDITTQSMSKLFRNPQQLVKVNLSCCEQLNSIQFLLNVKHTLRYLILYNSHITHMDDIVGTLLELQQLRFLDISTSPSAKDSYVNDLLLNPNFCPLLEGIDISNHTTVQYESIRQFCLQHPKINFIGMYLIPKGVRELLEIPNCKFTSSFSRDDIIESLKRYTGKRDIYLKVLDDVIENCRTRNETAAQLLMPFEPIVESIVHGLGMYRRDKMIQAVGIIIAIKFHQSSFPARITSLLTERIADILETVPLCEGPRLQVCQFQTLSYTILLDYDSIARTTYDPVRVMHAAFKTFASNQSTWHKVSLKLCSILFNRISHKDAAAFVNTPYIRSVVEIIIEWSSIQRNYIGVNMEFGLESAFSVLWSMTDESPKGCEILLKEIGLSVLFDNLGRCRPNSVAVEKILGIISNISEVPAHRNELINDDYFKVFESILFFPTQLKRVLVAGILSNLIVHNTSCWSARRFTKETIKNFVRTVVSSWSCPQDEIIMYRSFKSFVEWLESSGEEVKAFALLLMTSVTVSNPDRYCVMLLQRPVFLPILRIYYPDSSYSSCREFASKILMFLVRHYKHEDIDALLLAQKRANRIRQSEIARLEYLDKGYCLSEVRCMIPWDRDTQDRIAWSFSY